MSDQATTLWGADPTPVPAQQQQPMTDQQLAAALFTGPAEQRDYLTGQPLPVDETPLMRNVASVAVQDFGLEPDEAKESAKHWAQTFNTYGVTESQADHLVAIGVGVLSGRVEADERAWASDARVALSTEFGQSADLALKLARELVQRDPQLAGFLDSTGLGSHPRVVVALANAAWRKRGRL